MHIAELASDAKHFSARWVARNGQNADIATTTAASVATAAAAVVGGKVDNDLVAILTPYVEFPHGPVRTAAQHGVRVVRGA